MDQNAKAFWSLSSADILKQLQAVKEGLSSAEAGNLFSRASRGSIF